MSLNLLHVSNKMAVFAIKIIKRKKKNLSMVNVKKTNYSRQGLRDNQNDSNIKSFYFCTIACLHSHVYSCDHLRCLLYCK